jgi:hypothetical protein
MPQKKADAKASGLGDVLQQIGERRRLLDSLDAEITESIRLVEERMRQHLNVRVTVHLPSEEGWAENLTFGKAEGRWQLLLEAGPDMTEEGWSTKPLVNASRSMRADVFRGGHVRRLLLEAVEKLDSEIEDRRAARQAQEALADELGVVAQEVR